MALTPTEEAQTRQLIAQEAPLLSLASNEATITSKLGATKVNLSQLPAATVIASADLLLIRQGTTDKGVAASALKTYSSSGLTAANVSNTPAGNIAATTVQAAINELDAEKLAIAGNAATATTSANLAGGLIGQVPYQSAAGATAMLAAGTAGQVLQSNGGAAPSWVASATTTFASPSENIAGTIENKAVDPLGIRESLNASGSAPIYACRAWVNFNGTGTVAIRASGNVSSITDIGVGTYVVNLTTPMSNTNYSVVPGVSENTSIGTLLQHVSANSYATNGFTVVTMVDTTGANSAPTPADISLITAHLIG